MTFNVPANHKDLLKSAGSAIQVLSSTVKNAGMKAQAAMVQPPANPQTCRGKNPKTWTYPEPIFLDLRGLFQFVKAGPSSAFQKSLKNESISS